jgi:hypothetical protein
MTLFVILGLVAVVIGVLVAVALGVRSMRAQERAGDDWDSPEPDSDYGDADDPGEPARRRGDRRRQGTRRASGRNQTDDYEAQRGYSGRGRAATSRDGDPEYGSEPGFGGVHQRANGRAGRDAEQGYSDGYQRRPVQAPADGGEVPQLRDQEAVLSAAASAARVASRPMAADNGREPRGQARRRHMQRMEQPRSRARSPRSRGADGSEGWNNTNWDSVSDEDY